METEKGRGVTRDYSASGLYFESDGSFSLNESISLFMNLEQSGLGPKPVLHCRGEVVRIECVGGKMGVGVVTHSFEVGVLRQSAKEDGQTA